MNNIISNLSSIKFITTALPYANGDLHFGHFFEAVIADIYAKKSNKILISGDDQHGAAITIYANKNNLNINQHIQNQFNSHLNQYQQLSVDFSYFGQTHSDFHKKIVHYFYEKLVNKKIIYTKTIQSWFDESAQQFLPDRYIKGVCPHCHHDNVYPSICEFCGKTFNALELLHPISTITQNKPIIRETNHVFLNSKQFYQNLKIILNNNIICEEVKSKIFNSNLENDDAIDISRDAPYFGIEIPNSSSIDCINQFFYVWFDAPIGYISFALEYINNLNKKTNNKELSFEELINLIPYLDFHHIIGKDITYFHTYFWLNLLDLLDLNIVTKINTHGWIVLKDGTKLSKSNGDLINLANYSKEEIDAIRLFFFSTYQDGIQDSFLDFNL